MKGNKRIKYFASVLAFLLLFQYVSIIIPFVSVKAENAVDSNNVTWNYTLEGDNAKNIYPTAASILASSAYKNNDKIIIPSRLDGHTTVSIKQEAFGRSSTGINLTSEENKFKEIKSRVTSIEFDESNNLKEIGNYAFSGFKKVTSVTLPDSVTSIGAYAFEDCEKMQSFSIGSNVSSIGNGIFQGCTVLNNIVNNDNPNFVVEDGVLFNKDKTKLIVYPAQKDGTTYTIPETVTEIAPGAFYGCSKLESITLTAKITVINGSSFEGCTSLTTINGLENVTNIRYRAFARCTSLSNIDWSTNESITEIGDEVFSGCTNLKSVKLPSNITEIKDRTFYSCEKLQSITLQNNITTIGEQSFAGCTALTVINIPDSVSSIKAGAFTGTGLTSININNVKNLDVNAFGNNLKEILVNSTNTAFESEDGVLYNKGKTQLIKYPYAREATRFILPVSCNNIANNAFKGVKNATRVIVPDYYKTIGEGDYNNITIICMQNSYADRDARNRLIDVEYLKEIMFEDNNLFNKIKQVASDNNIYCIEKNSTTAPNTLVMEDYLTSIDLSDAGILSLNGIEKLTKLKSITANENKIQDVTPLDQLPKLETISLNSQIVEMKVLKKVISLPSILTKENDSKYNKNRAVTYNLTNAEINKNNETLTITSENGEAKITIAGGALDNSELNISPAEAENLSIETSVNRGILELIIKLNGVQLSKDDIDLEYSIDDGEYRAYTGGIELSEGEHTVKAKYFGNVITVANSTINVNLEAQAVRKNGRIYVYANSSNEIKYSLEGENAQFNDYNESIENLDKNKIWIKVGNSSAKELNIAELNEMYDIQTKQDMFDGAQRKNGIVTVKKEKIQANNTNTTDRYYSFDKKLYFDDEHKIDVTKDLTVENIDADIIYIIDVTYKTVQKSEINQINVGYYNINNISDDGYSKIEGTYTDEGKSYIFGQDRTYYVDSIEQMNDGMRNRYTIMDDDTDIKISDGKIVDITTTMGDTLILKEDGKVYKYGQINSIDGADNIIQIDGNFALTSDKKIKKIIYNYQENSYKYEDYKNITENAAKLVSIIRDNSAYPYVLYENGKAAIVKDGNTEEETNVIDISVDEEILYILKYDKVICDDGISKKEIDISNLPETPVKINKYGGLFAASGNYYEQNIESNKISVDLKNSIHVSLGDKSNDNIEIKMTEAPLKCEFVRTANIIRGYNSTPTKTGLKRIGDYTYQDNNGNVYYRTREKIFNYDNNEFESAIIENKVHKNVENNSVITKDESKLNENKVIINVTRADNVSKTVLPDNSEKTDKTFSYEATKNGEYLFKFIDNDGNETMKVIHVTTIQSRKETKVPKVTVLNNLIKLESDETIEYSLDNENWVEYVKEIEYNNTAIYARISNSNYECSILKITLDNNGNLTVENTENREVQGEILVNSLGRDEEKQKEINFKSKVEDSNSSAEESNGNKNVFQYISEIAQNIIYSFSSTDGKYAGCYFEDNVTEIMYKDMENKSVSINNFEDALKAENSNVEYGVFYTKYTIIDQDETSEEAEREKQERGEIYKYEKVNEDEDGWFEWKEIYGYYAYIDSYGNLQSNIDIINSATEEIAKRKPNVKYTKIVGDGYTFYILTEDGEVYIATGADNGAWQYLFDKLSINGSSIGKYNYTIQSHNISRYSKIISKLEVRDIINIYDTGTALTKDGKIISLIKDNEEDTSVVQELQKNTDKYLMASHLGLKNGKLYNFEDIRNAKEVVAGKLVKTSEGYDEYGGRDVENTSNIGDYKENDGKVVLFTGKYADYNDDGNQFVKVEEKNETLPEFIDVAEYRDSYLAMMVSCYESNIFEGDSGKNAYSNYEDADKYALCYALSKDGEIWMYSRGYVIDTGINLEFFGPTVNYVLDNVNWTNNNINLTPSGNTTGKISKIVIKKGEEIIYDSSTNNSTNTEKIIEKNGNYSIEVTDNKNRSYTSSLNVVNIDKVKPKAEAVGEIVNKTINIKVYDVDDQNGDYATSGVDRVQFTLEEPDQNTNWTDLQTEKDEQGNTVIRLQKVINNESIEEKIIYTKELDENGNLILKLKNDFESLTEKKIYARVIDNAGNIGDPIEIVLPVIESGKVIVKYEDLQGNELTKDEILQGEIGEDYQTSQKEFETYRLVEVVGNEKGTYTKEDQVVIYKYEKIEGKVTAKYQDLEGNKLADDIVLIGKLDEDYKTEQISIDNYQFKEVVGNEEGKYTKEDQEVIYKYEKIEVPTPEPKPEEGRLIVKYQDIEGNALKEDKVTNGKVGESYKTEKVDIYKYELKEIVGNEEGKYTKEDQVVIYKYEKVQGKVIIKYVDTEGNTIIEDKIITGKVDDPYKVDRIEIEGYDLIEVIGNEEGIYMMEDQVVTLKYEKIKQPVIPQTGQARIIYIVLGIIIFTCLSTLSVYNISNKKENDNK